MVTERSPFAGRLGRKIVVGSFDTVETGGSEVFDPDVGDFVLGPDTNELRYWTTGTVVGE